MNRRALSHAVIPRLAKLVEGPAVLALRYTHHQARTKAEDVSSFAVCAAQDDSFVV